jgi:hypothetical protein
MFFLCHLLFDAFLQETLNFLFSDGRFSNETCSSVMFSILVHWVIVHLEFEMFRWNEFDNCTPWNRKETETKANQVLIEVKWIAFSDHASKFDHYELHNPFDDVNSDECVVCEESFKDVPFSFLDKSGVDLIEKLQDNEDLEDVCEMNTFLSTISKFIVLWEPCGHWVS